MIKVSQGLIMSQIYVASSAEVSNSRKTVSSSTKNNVNVFEFPSKGLRAKCRSNLLSYDFVVRSYIPWNTYNEHPT